LVSLPEARLMTVDRSGAAAIVGGGGT